MDEALSERWQKILAVRNEVLRALEAARRDKVIGHPLDARVLLSLPADLEAEFAGQAELLRTVFIVSGVEFAPRGSLADAVEGVELEGIAIRIEPATGSKCERCWVRSESVGGFADQPLICDRCHAVVGPKGD